MGIALKRISWSNLSFVKVFQKIWQFFGGRMLLGLIAAVGSLFFFLWLADEVFEGATKAFDENIRDAVHGAAAPWLTQLMIFLSFIGSFQFLMWVGMVLTIVFLILKWKRAVALFLITVMGDIILNANLKIFYQRLRPEAFFDYPAPGGYSFPSGHAMGSFCFFGVVAWLITARLKDRRLKALIWSIAAVLIFLIGLSRIYLGVHFPSDVIAGYMAAFVWVFTIAFGDFCLKKRTEKNKLKTVEEK